MSIERSQLGKHNLVSDFTEQLWMKQSDYKFFYLLKPPFRVEAANKVDPSKYECGFVIVDADNHIGGPYRYTNYEYAKQRCETINFNSAKRIMTKGTRAEGL